MPTLLDLAQDLRHALDPVAFARQGLALDADPWQAKVLGSESKRIILNCSRQAGKSTVSAALALHTALYEPGSLVLLLSPSLRQSGELFRKVISLMNRLEPKPKLAQETALSFTVRGGGRVVSLPGSEETVRGFSAVSLLVVDEASYVTDGLYASVRPMLAVSNGRLILLSSPRGQRGFFHESWTNGGDDWERVKVPAQDVPRITPEFLEGERRALGPYWYAQEYLCEFLDTEDSVFSSAAVRAALSTQVEPLFGGIND